jgi:hypothetical protein
MVRVSGEKCRRAFVEDTGIDKTSRSVTSQVAFAVELGKATTMRGLTRLRWGWKPSRLV